MFLFNEYYKPTKLKKMKTLILSILTGLLLLSCSTGIYNDNVICYKQIQLSPDDKQTLMEQLKDLNPQYDPDERMITRKLTGWNYHTDAQSGTFHEVRASFYYAVMLLDLGDSQYTQRAFDVIEKTISLQDQDTTSKSCGVWPYYQEEPLATKKAPIDYNWADFNAVSLLDVWMGHQQEIPQALKPKIKKALILAGKAIQKRNVGPGYTNICIMGAYVTYMVSNLFNIPDMKEYARYRLTNFYNYTLDKGGFSEYNSPTYTIVALDELTHMKQHIVEPKDKQMIDSLYSIGWEMIAHYYHKPSGQWAGPHSRSYSSIVSPTFYSILKQASDGQIDTGIEKKRSEVKIKHHIPDYLMHYFLSPDYPRTETNVFEKQEPQIVGTTYLTDQYALSTANRSGLWNQRRPFLVYWGNVQSPKYLQVRFLHDFYDFSSASFFSQQKENRILAAINFGTNGGDKHISIDRLTDGKFTAKDLRLRFEFGNVPKDELAVPSSSFAPFDLTVDNLQFNIHLFEAVFDRSKGHWEKGGDETNSWVDFVIYSGDETNFDLGMIKEAALGFTFSIGEKDSVTPESSVKDGMLNVRWADLKLNIPVKPQPLPKNL